MELLGVSRSTLFSLRKRWLSSVRADGIWTPGISGGDRCAAWPKEVIAFLRDALSGKRPMTYAFAAQEAVRRGLMPRLDRAQVRHWAIGCGLVHGKPRSRETCHTRRWQRGSVGELWQLDATPFRWFGDDYPPLPMLNMVDDCTRLQVGGRIYLHENLAAYIDFLKSAFERYGLPLALLVDQAGFFKASKAGNETELQRRLSFFGVSLILANSPEAKGKIERRRQVLQGRLPPFFTHDGVPSDLWEANRKFWDLIDWNNRMEVNREICMRPEDAWSKATREGRNVIRQKPAEPWWEYVWSIIEPIRVMPGRKANVGLDSVPVEMPAGSRVFLCTHTDGTYSILKDYPKKEALPVVLYTTRKWRGK